MLTVLVLQEPLLPSYPARYSSESKGKGGVGKSSGRSWAVGLVSSNPATDISSVEIPSTPVSEQSLEVSGFVWALSHFFPLITTRFQDSVETTQVQACLEGERGRIATSASPILVSPFASHVSWTHASWSLNLLDFTCSRPINRGRAASDEGPEGELLHHRRLVFVTTLHGLHEETACILHGQ